MQLTEYAVAEDEELIEMILFDTEASNREVEVAQRLSLAIDLLSEHGLYT